MRKPFALMLVLALVVFAWAQPAGAGKQQLTDEELDGVSGGGDAAAASSQAGFGFSYAGATATQGGVTSWAASLTSVYSVANATAAAFGPDPIFQSKSSNLKAVGLALSGHNIEPFGNGKTGAGATAIIDLGSTSLGNNNGKSSLTIPGKGSFGLSVKFGF